MACKDCPEQVEQPGSPKPETPKWPVTRGSQGWVVYTGGPPEAHLAALKHVIPDDYERVTVHPDGSIEYEKGPDDWEPPSPIDGFIQDKDNPLLFYPQWKTCKWRMFSIRISSSCNCLDVVAQCNNPHTETLGAIVKCADCDQCSQRVEIPPLPPRPKRKTL